MKIENIGKGYQKFYDEYFANNVGLYQELS